MSTSTEPMTLAKRLRELAHAVTQGKEAIAREFTMRVPAEPERDADLVLSEAADLIERIAATTPREVDEAKEREAFAAHGRTLDWGDLSINSEDGTFFQWALEITFRNVWMPAKRQAASTAQAEPVAPDDLGILLPAQRLSKRCRTLADRLVRMAPAAAPEMPDGSFGHGWVDVGLDGYQCKFCGHRLHEVAAGDTDVCPANKPADTEMLDWLEQQASTCLVSIGFELDGGVHVTLDPVGGPRRAAREVDSVRAGIQRLMSDTPVDPSPSDATRPG